MDLTSEQIQLILYCFFRCSEEKQITQGSDFIASNLEAAKLYNALKLVLSKMDHHIIEECPSGLVDMTLARLKLIDPSIPISSQHRL